MKKFAVIGDPIKHSLSPIMHRWVFKQLNLNATYEKINVEENQLKKIISRINNGNLSGVNVTIPHKTSILPLLDEVNPRAEKIGAVNMVMKSKSKIIGNNTDWYGFSMAINRNKIEFASRSIILLGFGGVAKSILFALKNFGVENIIILKRNLSEEIFIKGISFVSLSKADHVINNNSIIINTTPLGMNDNRSAIDKSLINEKQILIDVIYNPLETKFIKLGKEKGAKTFNGLDMFIEQGLASLDLWFGSSISRKVNFTQLKSYLGAQLC